MTAPLKLPDEIREAINELRAAQSEWTDYRTTENYNARNEADAALVSAVLKYGDERYVEGVQRGFRDRADQGHE